MVVCIWYNCLPLGLGEEMHVDEGEETVEDLQGGQERLDPSLPEWLTRLTNSGLVVESHWNCH